MFTGLVTDVGTVASVAPTGDALRRVRIESGYDAAGIAIGASIACSGICLTAVAVGQGGPGAWFEVDVAAETLAVTRAGRWAPGTRLNLERSLRVGDELGGHIVTGHIDGLARVIARHDLDADGGDGPWAASARFELEAPPDLAGFIARKGSVALDGVSLTVNAVDGARFSVLIIPHTLEVTTLGAWQPGDAVHLEVDLMARYAARLAEARGLVAATP